MIRQITQKSDLRAPLLTDPNFLYGFKLCNVSRYLKYTSQENHDHSKFEKCHT